MAIVFAFIFFALPSICSSQTTGALSEYVHCPGKYLPAPLPANSFRILKDLDLNTCAAKCTLAFKLRDFQCFSFEYSSPTKTCVHCNITTYLLDGGYLGLKSNPAMHYYERSKGSFSSLFHEFPNSAMKKQDTYFSVVMNRTQEQCAYDCLRNTRDTCMSFSYSPSHQVCGLSNALYAKNDEQTLISSPLYNHYQYSTSWPCNASLPWNYSPRAIASPFFPYSSVQDVVCYVQIEAPVGMAVSLQFSTFFIGKNACDVARHGVMVYDGKTTAGRLLGKFCDSKSEEKTGFTTTQEYLVITFSTNSNPLAFKATYSFVNLDPCTLNKCQNSGSCVSAGGNYSCACHAGFTGRHCEINEDECASRPCLFNSLCEDMVNDFRCHCPQMLAGKRCEMFVGLCSERTCGHGICTPLGIQNYTCTCEKGFTGRHCDEKQKKNPCEERPCLNGGKCETNGTNFECVCKVGFTGVHCETDIDDCASMPCKFRSPCIDKTNDYECVCPSILAGKQCERFIGRCFENPCQNGNCEPRGADDFVCTCNIGYTGKLCDQKVSDPCQSRPCFHGVCIVSSNYSFTCVCHRGYTGQVCNASIDPCAGIDCNNGLCQSKGNGTYDCICSEGFQGPLCNEPLDVCEFSKCVNGSCVNTGNEYYCSCSAGFTGPLCDTLVDHCVGNACMQGECISGVSGYICNCLSGYTGQRCESRIDYCTINPCRYGNCSSSLYGPLCTCYSGYGGQNCTEVLNPCQSNPCMHGQCRNENYTFACVCEKGYEGQICDIPVDHCKGVTCGIGTCASTLDAHVCHCPDGRTGPSCNQQIDYCIEARCVNGLCQNLVNGYSCICAEGFLGRYCDVDASLPTITPAIGMQENSTTTSATFQIETTTIQSACDDTSYCFFGDCGYFNGAAVCFCYEGFTGERCNVIITSPPDPCSNHTCLHDGQCIPNGTDYNCLCLKQYTGSQCENFNLCLNNPCLMGTCLTDGHKVTCQLEPLLGYDNSTPLQLMSPSAHNATTAPSVLQRSDIECQTTSLKIFVPKNLVPENCPVTWRDSSCVVHSNGTHFVDSVGLRDCGTTLILESDSVVFENDLIFHKNGTQMQNGSNIVTYGSDYEFAIPVKCVYPRNSNISTSYIPIVQQVKILERRNGQLDLTMRQYEAEDYNLAVPFNAYPRQVPLNNDIFIRLAMENNVTGLGLSADNCFATSTPSPVDPNSYQLISSGCPVNNAKIHPSGINDVKFSFHAFNFRHNTSGIVYVHCQVSVCLDTDPACVVGCVTRKKRSASAREGAITSNLISTGPFILTADEGGVAMSTVVAAVSIAVAVIATVVAIIGWTRKSKKGADS